MRSGANFSPAIPAIPAAGPRSSLESASLRSSTRLAIETLVHIMQHGDKDTARVAAAQAILDRGYGRPQQLIDMGDGPTLRININCTDDRTETPPRPAVVIDAKKAAG